MARSHYIYLVCDKNEVGVNAIFTVKHEAITWMERNGGTHNYNLFRTIDGQDYHPEKITVM